ncbi:allophanate hydrolase subunit 2-domain-containing protein [Xylariaceae sp. FL0255]|nr:allophanate hydrolase subunit 2-domain-containing protein [Xylariaceae sp. FL0255]
MGDAQDHPGVPQSELSSIKRKWKGLGGQQRPRKRTKTMQNDPRPPEPVGKITTVLIANRGEIANRIIRTLYDLEIKAITIFSDDDEESWHVHDPHATAVQLEGQTLRETYLNVEQIIKIAKDHSADAIIPGYGFLSENAEFAAAVEKAGMIWIGPTPQQMSDLGLKHLARSIADGLGIPTLEGSTGLVTSVEQARQVAERISYPVIVKSSSGGGGIGLCQAHDESSLVDAMEKVQRTAQNQLGGEGILLECFINNARHIEVQVLGDGNGRVISLGTRDCSLQRRHQKVVEEAPASLIPTDVCALMEWAALRLTKHVNYRSAGTVEFLYDIDTQKFYFLEVNTRLQVEHPVTEAAYGPVDLVRCMVEIAAGGKDCDKVFREQWLCSRFGIEARVYAEDPLHEFLPCTGSITELKLDQSDIPIDEHVRFDTWIMKGTKISGLYDPLLGKIIARGMTREEALNHLVRGLESLVIEGVQTNVAYLLQVLTSDKFKTGYYKSPTRYLDHHFKPQFLEIIKPGAETTIQDLGRPGFWSVGVPPSGPMDEPSFRQANHLLNNSPTCAGLECHLSGPTIKFHCDSWIAVTGAACEIRFSDGRIGAMNQPCKINQGDELSIAMLDRGCRVYVAVFGGINVPKVLGSRSTFVNVGNNPGLGGYRGRRLKAGDQIHLPQTHEELHPKYSPLLLPRLTAPYHHPIPPQPNAAWKIGVIPGPHGAPDIFTVEGLAELFKCAWTVHYNNNRMGIRLTGCAPKWAREHGGSAGLHPSNIHDTPYSIGSVSFTGDEAVILCRDGPSLGGFAVFCVVATAEMWKLGQLKTGDTIKLEPLSLKQGLELDHLVRNEPGCWKNIETCRDYLRLEAEDERANLAQMYGCLEEMGELEFRQKRHNPIIGKLDRDGEAVIVRRAGDSAVLLEFGGNSGFEMRLSFEIYAFIEHYRSPLATPGVCSIHIEHKLGMKDKEILDELRKVFQSYVTPKGIQSRLFSLPFSFNDSSIEAAIERYAKTIRPEAPWLPSNINFLETLNGIPDLKDVVIEAQFLVVGLGDVYLGSPCAVAMDPRHRVFGTKYNPSRSFTPRGAVGLGGQNLCIYATDSPGGYQLIGKTANIWNLSRRRGAADLLLAARTSAAEALTTVDSIAAGSTTVESTMGDPPMPASILAPCIITPDPSPWLFRLFDRITFYPVSETALKDKSAEELEQLIRVQDDIVDLADYEADLEAHKEDIIRVEKQHTDALKKASFRQELLKPYRRIKPTQVTRDETALDSHGQKTMSPSAGRCWKVLVKEGSEIKKGEDVVILECAKMEVSIKGQMDGVCEQVLVKEGDTVEPNQTLLTISTRQ